jgi:hypothetical protein
MERSNMTPSYPRFEIRWEEEEQRWFLYVCSHSDNCENYQIGARIALVDAQDFIDRLRKAPIVVRRS